MGAVGRSTGPCARTSRRSAPLALANPLEKIHLDCDAVAVDEMVERLTTLRARVLPASTPNWIYDAPMNLPRDAFINHFQPTFQVHSSWRPRSQEPPETLAGGPRDLVATTETSRR